MSSLRTACVNDHALQFIQGRLRGRTEVAMQIESLLELETRVHFDLEEGFQVEDDALQVDDEYFRRLLYQDLLGDLLDLLVAVLAEIVGYFLWLDELVQTLLQGLHTLHLD